MRRVAFGLCVLAVLLLPATAMAAIFTDEAKLKGDVTVTTSKSLVAGFNVGAKFESIDLVCLNLAFEGNLLDPADWMNVSWIEKGQVLDGGGFRNPGTAAQSSRTFCYSPEFHPDDVGLFLDGKQRLKLQMEVGSVSISSLQLSIEGSPL